jgi:DHA1 family tetracycline resistance protein-like MFS transporter
VKTKSSALFTVFLVVVIDLIGFGIVLPLIPFYAGQFNATPVQIGMLYSIYSMSQLVFSPFWGGLSDRIGRRPVMLISTFGASLSYVGFALSHSLGMLFLSRLMAGMMGGNISTAQAYVADVTSHEDRTKGMGLIGAGFGIGFVIGPALATFLIHPKLQGWLHLSTSYRYAMPGFFSALLSCISFLMVLTLLPETVDKNRPQAETSVKRITIFSKTFWRLALDYKGSSSVNISLLLLCIFLITFTMSSLFSALPLFCEKRLGFSASDVGMFFAYLGIVAAFIQGILMKKLTQTFKETRLLLIGNILMLAGFILIPFSESRLMLIFFLAALGIGSSLNMPTCNSLISKEASPSQMGAMMGITQGIASLGRVLGPIWGGFLFDIWYGLPFIATGTIFAIAVWIAWEEPKLAHFKANE